MPRSRGHQPNHVKKVIGLDARLSATLEYEPNPMQPCKWPCARLCAPKAITATAHKLARIIYALVRYGVAYQKKSEDDYEAQHRQRMEKNLHRRAQELGDELKKREVPPTKTTPSPA